MEHKEKKRLVRDYEKNKKEFFDRLNIKEVKEVKKV